MTNTAGIPGDRICSFIERVERIDEEIKALNEGKKEVFVEATYADDAAEVVKKLWPQEFHPYWLSRQEGVRWRDMLARHGQGEVAKALLISAIPPTFMKSARNPDGVPERSCRWHPRRHGESSFPVLQRHHDGVPAVSTVLALTYPRGYGRTGGDRA